MAENLKVGDIGEGDVLYDLAAILDASDELDGLTYEGDVESKRGLLTLTVTDADGAARTFQLRVREVV